VRSVTASAGRGDVTHLILHHKTGLTSTVTVTLGQPRDAEFSELYLWGEPGRSAAPLETGQPVIPLRTARAELAANARSGQVSHPCDVRFGREIGHILAGAQRQIGLPSPGQCPRNFSIISAAVGLPANSGLPSRLTVAGCFLVASSC
jgi:hypothetical protein